MFSKERIALHRFTLHKPDWRTQRSLGGGGRKGQKVVKSNKSKGRVAELTKVKVCGSFPVKAKPVMHELDIISKLL